MSYFTKERKKYAIEDLSRMHECADKAGIRHALFVGFGLVLGIVREKDFIGHDNDIDMCIRADLITPEQELHYINLLAEDVNWPFVAEKPYKTLKEIPECGLFGVRQRWARRPDTGRYTWFSLRKDKARAKFCHWLMFPWNGYMWHTKGNQWVQRNKFDQKQFKYHRDDDAIMKGIPAQYLESFTTVNFHGLDVQIPSKYGSCLNFWYDNWVVPRKGGASAKKITCFVGKWENQKSWRIQVN